MNIYHAACNGLYEHLCSKLENKYFRHSTYEEVLSLSRMSTLFFVEFKNMKEVSINEIPFVSTYYKNDEKCIMSKREITLSELDLDWSWEECSETYYNEIKSKVLQHFE